LIDRHLPGPLREPVLTVFLLDVVHWLQDLNEALEAPLGGARPLGQGRHVGRTLFQMPEKANLHGPKHPKQLEHRKGQIDEETGDVASVDEKAFDDVGLERHRRGGVNSWRQLADRSNPC